MFLVPLRVLCRLQAPPSLLGWHESPDLLLIASRKREPLFRRPSRRPAGPSLTPPAGPTAGPGRLVAELAVTTGVVGVGGLHGPNNRRPAPGGTSPPSAPPPLRRSLAPILLRRLLRRPIAADVSHRASRRRFTPIGLKQCPALWRM